MQKEIKQDQIWKRNFGVETIEIIEVQDSDARIRQLTPSPGGGPSWGWLSTREIFEKYSLVYSVDVMVEKPPLGVMPKEIWDYKRMQELSRAIHECIDFGNLEVTIKWVNELAILLSSTTREEQ